MIRSDERSFGDTTQLTFKFSGELDADDVNQMACVVETAMDTSSELRMVLDFTGVETYGPSAFASPSATLTSLKSISPVARYAVVGAPSLAEQAVESFGKLLPLEQRTFDAGHLHEAQEWAFAE
ncbi:MAG: STAS/SEC14 domain-containing protein [Pseudomonadota bacterium]